MCSQFVFGWKSESSFRKSWPDLPVLSKRGAKEMAIPTDHGNLFCKNKLVSTLQSLHSTPHSLREKKELWISSWLWYSLLWMASSFSKSKLLLMVTCESWFTVQAFKPSQIRLSITTVPPPPRNLTPEVWNKYDFWNLSNVFFSDPW